MSTTYRLLVRQDGEDPHILERIKSLHLQHALPGDDRQFKQKLLTRAFESVNTFIFGAFDQTELIGLVCISFSDSLQARVGNVSFVVVEKRCRGQGIGETLLRMIIEVGRQQDATVLSLVSKPERIAARKMYQKIGFKLCPTGFFELPL